jgi:hypothetical protein
MKRTEQLTKSNFWDAMLKQYPEAMQEFCTWIDEYKKACDWQQLFNYYATDEDRVNLRKYHDIPGEMQYGIFISFINNLISEGKLPPFGVRFTPAAENNMKWDHIPRMCFELRQGMLKPPSKIISI